MRIVSLIASATEITCALGARAELVARSHECDSPADVIALPALTAPKFDTSASSRGIDDAVKSLVRDGLAIYAVEQGGLRAVAPDIILTQDQCEVCAASLKDVEAAVCDWVGRSVRIVSLRPNCLADIWADIRRVGAALERETNAERLILALEERIAAAHPPTRRVSAVCIEWIDPLMTAGHWIPELIRSAGAQPLLARAGGPSPYVTLAELAAADPDVVIVAPCGFDVTRSVREMPALAGRTAWMELRAVREGRVAIADGNKYFNRPSPAVADTAEIIGDILAHFEENASPRFPGHVWRVWRP